MGDATSSTPQRMSRYRSQRRAQQQSQEEAPEVPAIPQDDVAADSAVARSRSRYHKKNAANQGRPVTARPETARSPERIDVSHQSKPQSPPTQTVRPTISQAGQHRRANSTTKRHDTGRVSSPTRLRAFDESDEHVDADGYGVESGRRKAADGRFVKSSTDEANGTATSDARPQMPPSQPSGELFPPPRPEAVKVPPQPVRMDGPPESAKIRATKSMSQLPTYEDDGSEGGGCFGLFKRKRGEASPGASDQVPIARMPPNGLQDAPVSAINAGDRKVLVECGKSKSVFPVTVETTPVDIIKSAALCMSERINVRSAVLLENFGSVGVQRPLRRYECIRDVMNSWDTDRQNSLLLVDPGTGSSEPELSLAGVPKEKPGDISWLLSYSQKVGKWDKRMVTLRPDGQIVVQKDPDKAKHVENVCHMSDFDIYSPTTEKARKKIRPPKKYCFAVKSQQKTVVFESKANFVHFFCTNDKRSADDFHDAVQGWRSWYLVNVMGEGHKSKSGETATAEKRPESPTKAHRQGESMDSHYQLGSFKPLIEFNQFDQRPSTANEPPNAVRGFAKSANQFDPHVSPERRMSVSRKQYPPTSLGNKVLAEDEPLGNFPRRASIDQKRMSMENGRPDEFTTTGLLGRSYSQRQREMAEQEKQTQQPFTNGPSLLNNGYDGKREEELNRRASLSGPRRNPSTRARPDQKTSGGGGGGDVRRNKSTCVPGSNSGSGSGDLGRSGSVRKEMPKPLVDLKPEYREPPQHANKGKGYRGQIGPGGLVEAATSPEDSIGAPPATDWRGRNAQNSSPGTLSHQSSSGGLGRTQSQSRQHPRPTTSSRSPAAGESSAFTGEGLLAGSHARSGWGGGDRGRGVQSQPHAGGPLVDLSEESKFVPSSLLDRVERERGRQSPVIDRERRDE